MKSAEEPKGSLRAVLRSLTAGRDKEAVHLFVQALAQETWLSRADLPPLLSREFGRSRALALVRAFAEHPCMACNRGLLHCDSCKGTGSFADDRVCDRCIGLGIMSCEFCAGSGWITYGYVPVGLRDLVVTARAKLTLAKARNLLANADTAKPQNRRALAQELLRFNRLMGALNNVVDVAHAPRDRKTTSTAAMQKLVATCTRAAGRLDQRVRKLLRMLAENAEYAAQRAPQSAKRRLNERRANFYEALADSSTFTGTSLYHPCLERLRGSRQA